MDLVFFLVILSVLIGGLAAIFWFLRKHFQPSKSEEQSFLMLQNQIHEIARAVDGKLGESTRIIQRQFGESARIVRDVTEKLVRLEETNKQVMSFSEQLKNLQDILKNPKQRGILGEYYLETVLKNVLPPGAFQMQYGFSDGVIVDAVDFVDKRIIPIDSKFSLQNYNRILEAVPGSR